MSRPASALRFWSVLFILLACGWWWVTRTHAGSWGWAAALNMLPPQVLLPWPLWLAWWASRLKKRGWVGLNLLSAAVFTVSVVGFVLPRAESPKPGQALGVMTLNADFASAEPSRIAEVAQRENVQVIALQEGLNRSFRGAAYESALRAAFPGWTVVRSDELVVVSRLPVLGSQVVKFPHSAHTVLATRLRLGGQAVTVVNAHLPAFSLWPTASDRALRRSLPERLGRGLSVRRDFQGVVAGLLRQTADPFVLAGDLSMPPRGGVVNQLRYLHLHDAFAEGGVGFGFTHAALLPHSRLDYVWVRGAGVRQYSVLRDLLSDHRASVVRLAVPEAESSQP